jgi:predicted phosphodiesterase
VFLPCVVGNHGRRQRKPHAKNRAQDNFEYLFYHLIKKLLSGENGIEFVISEAADQPFRVYDTKYLLTHGDQFKGGSGIAGLWSPLMLGDARKRARESAVQRPYDHMIMGHWHQLKFFGNIIVNGSVSGLDEYAFLNNFGYEPPRQAFWVTDSVHGITITAPIHVAAKDEVYSAATGNQAIVGIGWGDEQKQGERS